MSLSFEKMLKKNICNDCRRMPIEGFKLPNPYVSSENFARTYYI